MDFLNDDAFTANFGDEIACIRRLIQWGALHDSVECSCGGMMSLLLSEQKKVFRCSKLVCGHREVSYRVGSFFLGSMLETRKIMSLARCWLKGETHGMARLSTGLHSGTVSNWYSAFRELVSCDKASWSERIGGPGVIVEVDETLLGRRKNNRGHHVEGAWVMVGIERSSLRRAFCTVVERRDADMIQSVVSSNVLEGSIVYTDGWRGYKGLDVACNVVHRTVNHSKFFKDPATGICTNTVEGLNGALKRSIPLQFRNNRYAPQYVDQFIWRRKNVGVICEAFIELLRNSLLTTKD
jgi:transposase-like protein